MASVAIDPWAQFPDAPAAKPAAVADPWAQFPDAPTATSGEIDRGNPMIATPPKPEFDPTANLTPGQKAAHFVAAGAQNALRSVADVAGTPIDLPAALSNVTTAGLNSLVPLAAAGVNKTFGTNFQPLNNTTSPAADLGSLFNAGLGKLGLPPQTSAAQTIANLFSTAAAASGNPVITTDQMSPAEKAWADPIRFATGSAISGAGLASRAPGFLERMAARPAIQAPADFLVRQYVPNAVKTVVGDAAAGAGAGVGKDAADKVAPNNPWVELAGMLAGGTGGAGIAEAGNAAKNGVASLFDKIGGVDPIVPPTPSTFAPFSTSQVNQAARELQGSAVDLPSAVKNLEQNSTDLAAGPTGVRPDQMPTSGLLSKDPGLVSAEGATRQTPTAGPDFVQRDNAVKGAAADRIASVRDPNANFDAVNTGVEDRQQAIIDKRDAEAIPLLKQAEASGATVDATPVAQLIDQKLAEAKRPPVKAALAEARNMLKPATVDPKNPDALDTSISGLYETRKAINDIIAGRSENPTGQYAKQELIGVRDALDDAINKADPTFGQYLAKYKEGSAPVDEFKASAGVMKLFNGQDPRDVAAGLLSGGFASEQRAKEIAATVANNPEAKQAWKSSVAEALYNRVTGTNEAVGGNMAASQAALAAQFKKNMPILTSVFDPEEMRMLVQGHKLLESFKAAENRATVGSQTTPNLLNSRVGKALQVGVRHVQGNLEAGGTFKTIRMALELLPSNRQSVDELSKMAWFDPGLMAYLLKKPLKNNAGAPYNVNLKRLFAADAVQQDNAKSKPEGSQ